MPQPKFNGLLAEIAEQNSSTNVSEFLQERLQLPPDKADELAMRIKKEYLRKSGQASECFPRKTFEQQDGGDSKTGSVVYSLDVLSEKEFKSFIKWLIEQLGYEVQPSENQFASVINFVATRDGEKTEVQAIKCPETIKVTQSLLIASNNAKNACGCHRSLVISTACFTQQTIVDAEKLGVELWDRDILSQKIIEAKKRVDQETQAGFPQYNGSLIQSLLRLDETKDFLVEPRADEKYDVYLSGVKFALLTFQAQGGLLIRCVYRIKNNQPVTESEGTALISIDDSGTRFGPDDERAYALVIEFLKEFLQ